MKPQESVLSDFRSDAEVGEISRLPGQPMYVQIKDALRTRILEGRYDSDARLPSEHELIAQFGVSRITVRQALGDLQRDGLLFKVRGKGSFVSRLKTSQELGQLEGFGEAMSRQGRETFNRLLGLRTVAATAEIARRLDLPAGSPVIEIRRVRILDREPISLDVSYFPREVGERLNRLDLSRRDIFSLLEHELGIALGRAELRIEATLADSELARLLRVAPGAPVLRIERLTHAVDGAPLDYEHLHYRGDAFQYRIAIERGGAGSLPPSTTTQPAVGGREGHPV